MYIYHRNIFENVNYAKKYFKLNDIDLNNEKYIELKNVLKIPELEKSYQLKKN